MARFVALALLVVALFPAALSAYTPPPCTFPQLYLDVPNADQFCPWIRELWREEISFGCGNSNYCPENAVTRAQLAEIVGRALHEHLWGQGRPGSLVHGVPFGPFEQLCNSAVGGVFMGLSDASVPWGDAAAACPSPFWVCTAAERGTAACNTLRPASACGSLDCTGACVASTIADESGWVADSVDISNREYVRESGIPGGTQFSCSSIPVWCCTGS